jgi:hypothetical protein
MRALLFVVVVFSAVTGYAADRFDAYRRKVADGCRACLEDNFHAITAENIEDLIASTSPYTAAPEDMAKFREEAEQMFKDTDVYMRVEGFELYWIEPATGFAYATVNQLTLPKDEADHKPDDAGKLYFRNRSALLPEYQLVQYKQKFQLVNGKWKLHLVLSEPIPEGHPEFKKLNASGIIDPPAQNNCPNGRCSTPFVTVR